jgi:DNA-binding CsgD family transcriptional regulator
LPDKPIPPKVEDMDATAASLRSRQDPVRPGDEHVLHEPVHAVVGAPSPTTRLMPRHPGLTTPLALAGQICLHLRYELGCSALALTMTTAHSGRVVLFHVDYSDLLLTYLTTEFIEAEPSYQVLVSKPSEVHTWDDFADFRDGSAYMSALGPAGFQQGSTVPLVDPYATTLGELHVNFRSRSTPRGFKTEMGRAAEELRLVLTALREAQTTHLTSRQRELVCLLAAGSSNREIARTLGISPRTVDAHVTNICSTMQVQTRLQAVTKALRLGLVELHA